MVSTKLPNLLDGRAVNLKVDKHRKTARKFLGLAEDEAGQKNYTL